MLKRQQKEGPEPGVDQNKRAFFILHFVHHLKDRLIMAKARLKRQKASLLGMNHL